MKIPSGFRGSVFCLHVMLLFFIGLFASCSTGKKAVVTITNPHPEELSDVPVVIARESLAGFLPVSSAGRVPAVFLESGRQLPSQADDLDRDGQWDEFFFLMDAQPEATQTVVVRMVEVDKMPGFPPRTQIRFAAITSDTVYTPLTFAARLGQDQGLATGRFQFEGPGWENDRVGFRNYFDARNGMDIFGKTTTEMVLHRVGINEDYHARQPWGMDVLRVGTSLGAGALALEKNGVLHRVAPTAKGEAIVLAEGPLRSILRFSFNDWEVDGQKYNLMHDVAIHAGAWYYESAITLGGATGQETIVTGITGIDLPEKTAHLMKHPGEVLTLSTYGTQAFAGEWLGMAVMFPGESFLGYSWLDPQQTPVSNTFAIRLKPDQTRPLVFRFYAVWQPSSEQFGTPDGFGKLLRRDALLKARPLVVTLGR